MNTCTCHCGRWTWDADNMLWSNHRRIWMPLHVEAYMVCERCQTRLIGDGTAQKVSVSSRSEQGGEK